eukprot:1361755-Amorphochlora_amoeboformis.AAC.1
MATKSAQIIAGKHLNGTLPLPRTCQEYLRVFCKQTEELSFSVCPGWEINHGAHRTVKTRHVG